ncbi:MAG: hypothetical protein AAGA70_16400 [Pseudomonadota bacterium]
MSKSVETKGRGFLLSSHDFLDGRILSMRGFFIVFSVAVLGNFLCGFGLAFVFGGEVPEHLQQSLLFGARLSSYSAIGPISAFSYLGSYFSAIFFPLAVFIIAKPRLLPRRHPFPERAMVKSIVYSSALFVLMLSVYFLSFITEEGEFQPYYYIFLFPIFPIFSALCSVLLTFPAIQLLSLFQLKDGPNGRT